MEILNTHTLPQQQGSILALHSGTGDGQDHLVDRDSLLPLLCGPSVSLQLFQSRGVLFPGQWGRWYGLSDCRLLLLLVDPAVLSLLQFLAVLGLLEVLSVLSLPELLADLGTLLSNWPTWTCHSPLSLCSCWTHLPLFRIPSISPISPTQHLHMWTGLSTCWQSEEVV